MSTRTGASGASSGARDRPSRRSGGLPLAIAAIAAAGLFSVPAAAEEGGSGHYQPGSMASFVDAVPAKPTFIVRYNLLSYAGSVDPGVTLPIAGSTTLGADASSWANGLTLVWRPCLDLGERWSYAMSTTIPLVSLSVTANVSAAKGAVTVTRKDSVTAIGDVVLIPLMLNYNVDPDLNLSFRLTGYAPTGSYEVGRLANTGKNFWTVEPTFAFMYFGTKNGRELSVFAGIDFNQENPDTHYRSGTQLHVDGTAAQHFPLLGGLAGLGLNAFYYTQITDDSGDGATFGAFRARDAGVGPAGSYVTKVGGGMDFIVELKWVHEFSTRNRLEGDVVFLKAILKL
jgi:hypothetical protein